MGFGLFALLGILIAVTGIKVVRDVWRQRREVFDRRFTEHDRRLVAQTAFYLLLPLSVALHELGHALAVWGFGGEVVDFGFYFFAGFVSYEASFTPTQEILVAAAGPFVNVLLAGAALAVIFLRRPPMRAAYNELLFQFATLSAVNALIFYPLLDVATGLNGDFTQMYRGGVPALSATILAVHVGILGGGYLLSKNERFSRHLARLTGLPPDVRRGLLGGMRLAAGQAVRRPAPSVPTPSEATMRQAASRIASGWPHRLDGRLQRGSDGASLTLTWTSDGTERRLALLHREDGETLLAAPGQPGYAAVELRRWQVMPSADELVVALRMAMEQVEQTPATSPSPAD